MVSSSNYIAIPFYTLNGIADLMDIGISTPSGSGSRRGSVSGANPSAGAPPPSSFPTASEIHAAIPASGILSNDLLRMFRSRLGNSRENHRRFIGIVKDVSVFGKEDKLLRPGVIKEA